jgi:cytochrome d oxidase subunit CydB
MIMFWIAVLIISTLLYVLLDGFDLGVGILFGLTQNETRRAAMMSAISPIWDGNETWLVVAGVVLWGAFPVVYATLFPAFYLAMLLMLAGLILRGVSFEYRHKTERMRWVWDAAFAGGSLVAAFIQGLMVGAWSRDCRSRTANILAACSAGSARLPSSVASAYVWAIPSSAPAGLSTNAKAKSATRRIARSLTWRLN